MTLVVNNLLALWRQLCLHGHIRQRRLWESLFKRRFINGLTYLLIIITTMTSSIYKIKTCSNDSKIRSSLWRLVLPQWHGRPGRVAFVFLLIKLIQRPISVTTSKFFFLKTYYLSSHSKATRWLKVKLLTANMFQMKTHDKHLMIKLRW